MARNPSEQLPSNDLIIDATYESDRAPSTVAEASHRHL
jgi:hypothetical protein